MLKISLKVFCRSLKDSLESRLHMDHIGKSFNLFTSVRMMTIIPFQA